MRCLVCLALLLCTACAGPEVKGEGEECFGTSECAPGLVCNAMFTPAVCSLPSDRPPVDAAVSPADAADTSDGAADTVDATPDTPDAAPDTPDAAPPDAAPDPVDAAVADAAA